MVALLWSGSKTKEKEEPRVAKSPLNRCPEWSNFVLAQVLNIRSFGCLSEPYAVRKAQPKGIHCLKNYQKRLNRKIRAREAPMWVPETTSGGWSFTAALTPWLPTRCSCQQLYRLHRGVGTVCLKTCFSMSPAEFENPPKMLWVVWSPVSHRKGAGKITEHVVSRSYNRLWRLWQAIVTLPTHHSS